MIVVDKLTKQYGDVPVLQGVSFEVPANGLVGFLGVNGAGKTTTMRILTTALQPTSGTVHICGVDVITNPQDIRSDIGYLPEQPPLYPQLTIGQYLEFVGGLRQVSNLHQRIGTVLEQVGLLGKEDLHISKLSKGYRQRLGLAQALVHDPKVIILDEPASGLDPSQMVEIRSVLKGLAEDRTVLLSTHLLGEAEKLCDYNIILHNGVVGAHGRLADLASQFGGTFLEISVASQDWSADSLLEISQLSFVERVEERQNIEKGWCVLQVKLPVASQEDLRAWFAKQQIAILGYQWKQPSLEDIFLHIVGVER